MQSSGSRRGELGAVSSYLLQPSQLCAFTKLICTNIKLYVQPLVAFHKVASLTFHVELTVPMLRLPSRVRSRSLWTTCLKPSSARRTEAAPCLSPSSTCSTSWTSRRTNTRYQIRTYGTHGRATGEFVWLLGLYNETVRQQECSTFSTDGAETVGCSHFFWDSSFVASVWMQRHSLQLSLHFNSLSSGSKPNASSHLSCFP